MKNYQVKISVEQLQELLNLVNAITAFTDNIHSLTYAEIICLYRFYTKLAVKVQTANFRKRGKLYSITFAPIEAEVFIKFVSVGKVRVTPYAENLIVYLAQQFDKQGQDLRQTFLSQHPFKTGTA